MTRRSDQIRDVCILIWEDDKDWGVEGVFQYPGMAMEAAEQEGVSRDGWTSHTKTPDDYRRWESEKVNGLYWTVLSVKLQIGKSERRNSEQLRSRHDPGFLLISGGNGLYSPREGVETFEYPNGYGDSEGTSSRVD